MAGRSHRGLPAIVLAGILILAACSGTGPTARGEAISSSVTTTTAPSTTVAPAQAGRLVVIDATGNVVTMRPDGTNRRALTDDAGVTSYYQPQWSPRGDSLAWAETTAAGFALTVNDGDDSIAIPMPAMPFFYMWSPDATRIGVLHNAAGGGLEFEIVDVAAAGATVAANGAPFFFSWSPDGRQIVSHVGLDDLSILGAGGVTPLGSTGRDYQAPSWTPAGIFYLDDGKIRLQDPAGASRSLASVSGPTTMVAAPDGSRLAVQVFGPDDSSVFAAFQSVPEIPTNVVAVLDLATGNIEVASGEPSFGYFWSPDGTALLVLVLAAQEGELEWRVWRHGENTSRVAFTPTRSLLRDVLPFFDQYAQSWRQWAPDSSAFAFVGMIDGTSGVWVQEVDGAEPRFVVEGSWVAWSAE